MCVLVGLTAVDKLEVFFYIGFCCFSDRKVLFLAIIDAMASSPRGGATIDLLMRILKGRPDFILVLKKPSVYRAPFQINSTFTGSRYDVIVLFPKGGAASDNWILILNGRP